MTPTQIARRSDALYADGTRGMTRRVLCDMVAQRESDLEDARAEFDKMDKWHSAELQAALAENAKLRELVRLMVRRHTPISPCKNIPCGECPVKDECDQEDTLMRELGVEVDE